MKKISLSENNLYENLDFDKEEWIFQFLMKVFICTYFVNKRKIFNKPF